MVIPHFELVVIKANSKLPLTVLAQDIIRDLKSCITDFNYAICIYPYMVTCFLVREYISL